MVDDVARTLVRNMNKRRQLSVLVTKLETAKPLVQWPAPLKVTDGDSSTPSTESGEHRPAEREPADGEPLEQVPVSHEPTTLEKTSTSPPVAADHEACDEDGPLTATDSTGRDDAGAPLPLVDPYLAAELIDEPNDDQPARGFWARGPLIVAGGCGLLAAAIIGGFYAGRASTPETPTASSSTSSLPTAPNTRAPLARLASNELARAVNMMAAVCGIADLEGSPSELLARAFVRCRQSSSPGSGFPATLPPSLKPALYATPPFGAGSVTPSRPRPVGPGTKRRPPATRPRQAKNSCILGCDEQHENCKRSRCGAEPTSGSDYASYQRCLASCLRASSACRLQCQ